MDHLNSVPGSIDLERFYCTGKVASLLKFVESLTRSGFDPSTRGRRCNWMAILSGETEPLGCLCTFPSTRHAVPAWRHLAFDDPRQARHVHFLIASNWRFLSLLPTPAISLRRGTKHYVIGPYIESICGGISVVVPLCSMRHSAAVLSMC